MVGSLARGYGEYGVVCYSVMTVKDTCMWFAMGYPELRSTGSGEFGFWECGFRCLLRFCS